MPIVKMRLWSIPDHKFQLLLKRLPFTDRMREALTLRYTDDWRSRSSVAGRFDLSEHGVMKAEKSLIEAHTEFEKVYGNGD